MKRRSFLTLLGLAPIAAPAIGHQLNKSAVPTLAGSDLRAVGQGALDAYINGSPLWVPINETIDWAAEMEPRFVNEMTRVGVAEAANRSKP